MQQRVLNAHQTISCSHEIRTNKTKFIAKNNTTEEKTQLLLLLPSAESVRKMISMREEDFQSKMENNFRPTYKCILWIKAWKNRTYHFLLLFYFFPVRNKLDRWWVLLIQSVFIYVHMYLSFIYIYTGEAKVVIVGNGGVGKTSMIRQYCKGCFPEDYKKTIGVDFLERHQWVVLLAFIYLFTNNVSGFSVKLGFNYIFIHIFYYIYF